MYVIYCQNKPVSEHIVAEHFGYFEEIRLKLKHKLVVSVDNCIGVMGRIGFPEILVLTILSILSLAM